ncbi:MAG: carbamoyl-phosphate synthase (glutamine-hydrolyzing) large subunit [Gammaproteobacteria bacterium]
MSFFDKKGFKNKKVLLLGSGGLRIGQAGEFDYSGSQAIKALKEEGIRVVLVNPNIATVQTEPGLVDELYLQPLNVETVKQIIEREKPDGIMLGFGGQTALNLGLELSDQGILEKHNIEVLGTSLDAIRLTEDRNAFKSELLKIGVKTPESYCCSTLEEVLEAAESIGYPVMMRSGFTLGGLGSGKIESEAQLRERATEILAVAPHVLIEEYLIGWKELEYEIVRDCNDSALTICNMENMDPMGVHTGESIVVAPSQTLTNNEYHFLRRIAIKAARHFKILGECNIQYALNPENGDYRVIEMNARLSRSSALASKATGYPLAFVAAKLALRYPLHEIKNSITQKTCAFFEPALDYVVVKIPRWDTQKLKNSDRSIGTEMKSVGEVMSIGRSFPEALQKAAAMLNIGASSICDYPYTIENPEHEIHFPTDRRLFAIAEFFKQGGNVEKAQALSNIHPWFLNHIYQIVMLENQLKRKELTEELLLRAKKNGFSDKRIATLRETDEQAIRKQRKEWGITPFVKQIDTLAGEFDAQTNYLYMTYHGVSHDVEPSEQSPVIVLGSGPYSIGSSVEFDWCGVITSRTLREFGEKSIIINSNPETVSTDYDESDRLYFEQLSLERTQDIADFENPKGIVVGVGGQIANNLVMPLHQAGYPILGTKPANIDMAENRKTFSTLLNQLDIDQPAWTEVTTIAHAKRFAKKVGYPVLIRPSYVLSGAAMKVVRNESELEHYLKEASIVSPDHPVVLSDFIEGAKELEIDGVADDGEIVVEAISEHVENAGVHSGDATIVLPPQQLYLETIRRTKKITRQVVKALKITGPFNIQFIAKNNAIRVIECNVRASRSFPFVSKVTQHNFIKSATAVILNQHASKDVETLELDYVGVKTPQFSYNRLKGADPVAHVEMASTGEVGVIGDDLTAAFYQSWRATDQIVRGKNLFLSLGGENSKVKLLEPIKKLNLLGFKFFATEKTHAFLERHGIPSTLLYKSSDEEEPNIRTHILEQKLDLIVTIPSPDYSEQYITDGYVMRRLAVDHHIPLITNIQLASIMLKALSGFDKKRIPVKSYRDFIQAKQNEAKRIEKRIAEWQLEQMA